MAIYGIESQRVGRMQSKAYYYSTKDLLTMAALASLGGVSGTYINALGDAVQSVLGFAGGTQWAAGLHTLWLVLAAALVPKAGAGTFTGLLKGGVELLSGNSHGILVVLIDVVAGILVDFGFLIFRRRDRLAGYLLSGGLSAASNVFVFQIFAELPADTLAFQALLLVAVVAGLSGVILAGYLGFILLKALARSGVWIPPTIVTTSIRFSWIFLAIAALMAVILGIYLQAALRGPVNVEITGALNKQFLFPEQHGDIRPIQVEASMRGTTAKYTGIPLKEILAAGEPKPGAGWVLVQGADGYSFFITMEEITTNPNLLLSESGQGDERAYNLVGAENSKAWVRGVAKVIVIKPATFQLGGKIYQPGEYDAGQWQFEMDSTQLSINGITGKYQGVPLGKVLSSLGIQSGASEILIENNSDSITLPLDDALGDEDVRIFTIIDQASVTFALARLSGEVMLPQITAILVR